MNSPFTRRKFLRLDPPQQHKYCAQLLRLLYEALHQGDPLPSSVQETYATYLDWMNLLPFAFSQLPQLADRYHWHLAEAGRCLKEHNLLPRMRTGDREPQSSYLPVAIYLDRIRSAYNVGSILRTNEALRIGEVHFSQETPFLDNEKVERTAMGAAAFVPCFRATSIEALPRPLIALDTCEDAVPLNDFLFPARFTLILGNEEYGISPALLGQADLFIEIPMLGAKNSLNVACAFAIAAAQIRLQANAAIISHS